MSFQRFSLPSWPEADAGLVDSASKAVLAQERLCRSLRRRQQTLKAKGGGGGGGESDAEVVSLASKALDDLREQKSRIEGTHFHFKPIQLQEEKLSQLKHLALSHTPSTLQEDTKAKMATLLSELFEGQVKKLLYACVLTCPWFSRAQAEVSAQARCNLLYVVFVSRDEQFFSLAAPHERELCETIDEGGFFFATEIRHFCHLLSTGNVRAVEAYCSPPESLVLSGLEWFGLASLTDPVSLLHKHFVDRCLGQAHGGIIKKRKVRGQLVLREDVTLQKFCDSFKLLEYTGNAVRRESISPWTQEESWKDQDASEEKEAMLALRKGFEGVFDRELLFQLYCSLRKRLECRVSEVPSVGVRWGREMGQWLASVRMDTAKLIPLSDPPADVQGSEISSMLSEAGVPSILPTNVLAIAKAGSHMYNLALPSSDTDYIVVFCEPTQSIVSSYAHVKESMDSRGMKKDIEGSAYEARMFCEMLRKGAVNMVEMVFAGDLAYSSEAWKCLVAHKELFMSETVILQFIGFVKTHMSMIAKGKHSGTPRERKIFYQIFHKLDSLASFVDGGYPLVQCRGEQRDFIMRIRNGPLEGELSPERLYSLAEERLGGLRDKLSWRERRWREVGDYRFLQTWLLSVRGVSLEEPLKMAKQPIGI